MLAFTSILSITHLIPCKKLQIGYSIRSIQYFIRSVLNHSQATNKLKTHIDWNDFQVYLVIIPKPQTKRCQLMSSQLK